MSFHSLKVGYKLITPFKKSGDRVGFHSLKVGYKRLSFIEENYCTLRFSFLKGRI